MTGTGRWANRGAVATATARCPDHAFIRTRPVMKLFEIGTDFVSRSEARRLLDDLEEDFEVVDVVPADLGQRSRSVLMIRFTVKSVTWSTAPRR